MYGFGFTGHGVIWEIENFMIFWENEGISFTIPRFYVRIVMVVFQFGNGLLQNFYFIEVIP